MKRAGPRRHEPGVRNAILPDRHAAGHLWIVLAIGIVVVGMHAFGAFRFAGVLWGTHAYAFLPAAAWTIAVALLVIGVVAALLRFRAPAPAPAPVRMGRRVPRVVRALAPLGVAVGGFAVLWFARTRQILLGDGMPLVAKLPFDHGLHDREPLTAVVHQHMFRIVQAAQAGRDVHEVARDAVALGSVLAGVGFLFAAYGLGLELLRLRPGPEAAGRAPRLAVAVAAVFCVQGFVQLFFGYVENYAFEALAVALYLWTSLLWARGAAPLVAPAACLMLAIALDLSAALLAPSFVLLATIGLVRRGRRLATLRDLLLTFAVLGGIGLAFYTWGSHYRLDQQFIALARRGVGGAAHLLSLPHVRDFTNEQMLIGPFAMLWFLAAGLHALLTRAPARTALVFLGFTALVQAVVFWRVPDLPLGYARDWDLFAPFATVFVAAGLASFLVQVREPRAVQRVLAVVLLVSCFHTAPWIAVNASADRALERFKQLPLGHGRTESTVGFWYFSRGRLDEARVWLQRALQEDPDNVRAYAHLGSIDLSAGRYEAAAQEFTEAVARRPNQPLFRQSLVTALLAQNRVQEALGQLQILVGLEPQRPRHWAMAAILLDGLGRRDEAQRAMQHAAALAPGDSIYVRALETMSRPDAWQTLVASTLPQLLDR